MMTEELEKVDSSVGSEHKECQHPQLALESTSDGYLTGNYVCKDCGVAGMVVFPEPKKA